MTKFSDSPCHFYGAHSTFVCFHEPAAEKVLIYMFAHSSHCTLQAMFNKPAIVIVIMIGRHQCKTDYTSSIPVFTWTYNSPGFSFTDHQAITMATNILLARWWWSYWLQYTMSLKTCYTGHQYTTYKLTTTLCSPMVPKKQRFSLHPDIQQMKNISFISYNNTE